MIIRASLASDSEAIDTLFREFVAYLRSIGDKNDYHFGAQEYLRDGFGVDPILRGFVAEDSGQGLLGYILFSRTYDGDYVRNFYVVDLYVRQDSRGRGVGRMLMEAVRNLALTEGIARLSWAVHKSNSNAMRFYESLGAQYVGDTYAMYLDIV